ncbi:hypothetical protein [Gordonia sp. UCD-TK1]|uniref:hypothetical protein n=1 Tax=Gordonia sp. UCD-TK1 TaxID=1857893 RepID=UPI00080E36F6|nr:hypothetical protein [Gordonia sp. UCD-TK1]OCH80987.1 hypothetical protein A9310_19680 [Gordonia sp. UCD-TK1]
MNRTDDLIGDIDALIDDQLAQGEAVAEARADDADRPCGHCGSDWHGLPITERLEEMRLEYGNRVAEARRRGEEPEYADSAIIDGYRYADDDSEVLCPGSEFIGALTTAQVGFAENGRSCTCRFCTLAAARRTSFAAMVGGQVSTWMMPPRPIRGRARWLRANLTHLRDAEMVDIDIEYTTMSVFGLSTQVRGPSRNAVLTIVVNHVRASLNLVPDASRDFAVRDVAYDEDNPDASYLRALAIHTREDPPDLGGQLEWVEVDGPHGDPIVWSSSTEVQPYGWDWALLIAAGLRRPQFDWGGVIWGAPWVVWRDGAIAEGDRVGVEIDGRVFVDEVTNADPRSFTIGGTPATPRRSGRLLSALRRLRFVP